MAKKSSTSISSSESFDSKNPSLTENIIKKLKFLGTVKKYIVSKVRSGKYDVQNTPKQDITIISYDQRSFSDIEMKNDLETSAVPNSNQHVLQTLKKVLNLKLSSAGSRNGPDSDLLEVVEKTFTRQLDIFEEILKLSNSKQNHEAVIDKLKKKLNLASVDEDSVDNFINDVIQNVSAELMKTLPPHEPKQSIAETPLSTINEDFGDSGDLKKIDVSCECQFPSMSGAAVYSIRR